MGLAKTIYGNNSQPQGDEDAFDFEDFTEEITKRVYNNIAGMIEVENVEEELEEYTYSKFRIVPQPSNDKIMILNDITNVTVNSDGAVIFEHEGEITFIVSPNCYSNIFKCNEEGKPLASTGWF